MKHKVLIVSHTNQTIDGLCVKMKESKVSNFVRVSNNA